MVTGLSQLVGYFRYSHTYILIYLIMTCRADAVRKIKKKRKERHQVPLAKAEKVSEDDDDSGPSDYERMDEGVALKVTFTTKDTGSFQHNNY